MATDEEQLAITVIAKLTELEKNMAKASGITAKAFREMSLNSKKATKQMEDDAARSAKRINQAFATIGTKVGGFAAAFGTGLIAKVSLQGAQQLIDSATRIQNSLKVAGLEGSELTKVYDRLYISAQKNAAPLEALVTLYGRASLVQKDLKASTEDMLNFTDKVAVALRASGSSAEESSGALLQLSQLLGSGVVRAEEFNSVQEGALPILQAVAAGLKEAGGSVSKLRSLVVDGKVSSEAFFRAFEAGSSILTDKVAKSELTVSQGFVRLQNVLIDTAGKLNDTTGASVKVGQALNTMATIIQGVGGIVRNFADSDLGHLAGKLYEVLNPLGVLIDKIGGIQNLPAIANAYAGAVQEVIFGVNKPKPHQMTPDEILRAQLAEAGKGDRVGSAPKPVKTEDEISDRINQAFSTNVKPVSLDDYALPVTPKTKKPKKVKAPAQPKDVPRTADDRINSDIQDVKDRTAALQEETAMVGLSYEAQEKRRMALDLEQHALADLREEARKKGETDLASIKLSDDQKAKIDQVSAAYASQAAELRKVQAEHELAEQTSAEFYDSFKSGAIDAINGTKSLGDAIEGLAKKISDLLLNNAFDALFKPASGGNPGGTFGGLFSGIGSLFGGGGGFAGGGNLGYFPPMPKFAGGGISDQPSIFAEAGPEAAVPLPDGRRIPVDLRTNSTGSASKQDVSGSIEVSLSKELIGQILQQSHSNSIKLVQQNNKDQQNFHQNGGE